MSHEYHVRGWAWAGDPWKSWETWLVRIGLIAFRFAYGRTPKTSFLWFRDFQQCPWLQKPTVFILETPDSSNKSKKESQNILRISGNDGTDGGRKIPTIRLINSWESLIWDRYLSKTWNENLANLWNIGTRKLWNQETKKPRNIDAKKLWNQETKRTHSPSTYRLPPLHPTTIYIRGEVPGESTK